MKRVGHEDSFLHGAEESIRSGIVERIQFEYNNYWLKSGKTLAGVLNCLNSIFDADYYRLTPWGKLRVSAGKILVDYKHFNYLVIKRKSSTYGN